MLYISFPAADAEFLYFYHQPSHLLFEFRPCVGPSGSHFIRGFTTEEIPGEALTAIIAHIESINPGASDRLTSLSGALPSGTLPESIILASESGPIAILIHYPAIGFTAGIRDDGTKIPPHWRDPAIFTPEQRSHFLAQAAEILMQAIAKFRSPPGRQAT